MQEGVDYIVAQDPESTDDSQWLIIICSGEWENFIIKYTNIQILKLVLYQCVRALCYHVLLNLVQ